MELLLKRDTFTDKSSIGKLYVDGLYCCETLEDRTRPEGEKVHGETAIPLGRYSVAITHSPRFGIDMPLLLNVPGFEGVRIHPGNRPADTEGCILVGTSRAEDMILESRDAYAELFKKLQAAQGPIFLTATVEE